MQDWSIKLFDDLNFFLSYFEFLDKNFWVETVAALHFAITMNVDPFPQGNYFFPGDRSIIPFIGASILYLVSIIPVLYQLLCGKLWCSDDIMIS